MNILKDKSYKTYSYTSRYSVLPYYYNTEDDTYVYGIARQLKTTDVTYHTYTPQPGDTYDDIALMYYGRPDLYWVITDFNHVRDVYDEPFNHYKYLNIPELSGIAFK